jgi:hypothetical protein
LAVGATEVPNRKISKIHGIHESARQVVMLFGIIQLCFGNSDGCTVLASAFVPGEVVLTFSH